LRWFDSGEAARRTDNMSRLYYSHRLTDSDPATRRWNLSEAKRKLAYLQHKSIDDIWAPWLDLADSTVGEAKVWRFIEAALACCDGLLIDLRDGGEESDGMRRERELAENLGLQIETLIV
jgi:hypothetical protein